MRRGSGVGSAAARPAGRSRSPVGPAPPGPAGRRARPGDRRPREGRGRTEGWSATCAPSRTPPTSAAATAPPACRATASRSPTCSSTLRAAGYKPQVQTFDFPFFKQLSPSAFDAHDGRRRETFAEGTDFDIMSYSGSGDVDRDPSRRPPARRRRTRAPAAARRRTSPAPSPGEIALMQRGTCPFGRRSRTPRRPARVGAIVMNQGDADNAARTEPLAGTLGGAGPASRRSASPTPSACELADSRHRDRALKTETPERRPPDQQHHRRDRRRQPGQDRLVGSHLDSVAEGPGINDNGTGSAFNLELALQMAKMAAPANKVRFAWWGAEESGPDRLDPLRRRASPTRELRQDHAQPELRHARLAEPREVRLRRRLLGHRRRRPPRRT